MPAARATTKLARLGLLAAVLTLPAACGGGGGGAPSSSSSLSGKLVVPHGYAVYRSQGFSFAYPSGWRVSPYQSDPTQSGVSAVPPGSTPVQDAFPRIDTERSAARASFTPTQDFDDFVANIQDETSFTLASGQALARTVSVSSVKVPGAAAARLLTVTGSDERRELDLIVLVPAGVIKLSVEWYPANEQLSPRTVIDSLRLNV